uniref:Uncharacterized protein n=1 Tax=Steinernema glaseri TaxID=37863 RepID=A0A1I7Y3R3_9BILA
MRQGSRGQAARRRVRRSSSRGPDAILTTTRPLQNALRLGVVHSRSVDQGDKQKCATPREIFERGERDAVLEEVAFYEASWPRPTEALCALKSIVSSPAIAVPSWPQAARNLGAADDNTLTMFQNGLHRDRDEQCQMKGAAEETTVNSSSGEGTCRLWLTAVPISAVC